MKNLCDHMNAEIEAGTVTNLREAVIWIQYTYMYIRMRKNPLVYGISNEERMRDPSLFLKCEWAFANFLIAENSSLTPRTSSTPLTWRASTRRREISSPRTSVASPATSTSASRPSRSSTKSSTTSPR